MEEFLKLTFTEDKVRVCSTVSGKIVIEENLPIPKPVSTEKQADLLAENNVCPSLWMCNDAVERGDLEALKWARAFGAPWNYTTCNIAAKTGNLTILQYLRENGCPWIINATENGVYDKDIISIAVSFKQPKILHYLFQNGGYFQNGYHRVPEDANMELLDAIQVGDQAFIQKFKKNSDQMKAVYKMMLDYAIINCEYLKMIDILSKNGLPQYFVIPDEAFVRGSWNCINYIHDKYLKTPQHPEHFITVKTVGDMVSRGKVDDMKKLGNIHSSLLNVSIINSAAANNNYEMFVYLKTINCPWDNTTFDQVLEKKNIKILKFCIENGCPNKMKVRN